MGARSRNASVRVLLAGAFVLQDDATPGRRAVGRWSRRPGASAPGRGAADSACSVATTPIGAVVAGAHRHDVDEAQALRRRGDEPGARAADPLAWDVGRPARPRAGHAVGEVVDGDRDVGPARGPRRGGASMTSKSARAASGSACPGASAPPAAPRRCRDRRRSRRRAAPAALSSRRSRGAPPRPTRATACALVAAETHPLDRRRRSAADQRERGRRRCQQPAPAHVAVTHRRSFESRHLRQEDTAKGKLESPRRCHITCHSKPR